ncbi:hypothetical protein [Bradyrhizobium sp. USDA 3256]
MTLQAAFGWTDSDLFEFLAGEGHWGIPDPDGDFGPSPSMPARRGSAISSGRPAPRRSIISRLRRQLGPCDQARKMVRQHVDGWSSILARGRRSLSSG